jgi:glycine/D-amino acid oxidase-like deaminating enzyme
MGGLRERTLEELGLGVFGLLVIGGGIVGGRVAFDAARAGLRVALVDAGDFGGATSGASARLVHGGLRYHGTGDFRLVRTALRERDVLASRVAPHLVRPLPFVLAAAGGRRQRSRCAAGLLVYAALDGFRRPLPRFVTPEEAALLVPPLCVEGPASHAVYHEAITNDSRLVLATVTAAARSGAVVANYLRAVDLDLAPGKISRVSLRGRDGEMVVRCKAVVNATGPWLDQMRKMEESGCEPVVRLSKGIHVVLSKDEQWRAAVAVSRSLPGPPHPETGILAALLVSLLDTRNRGPGVEANQLAALDHNAAITHPKQHPVCVGGRAVSVAHPDPPSNPGLGDLLLRHACLPRERRQLHPQHSEARRYRLSEARTPERQSVSNSGPSSCPYSPNLIEGSLLPLS